MATAKYKAIKPFDDKGTSYGIGMVLILDPKKATDLVETGKIRLEKYLDPEDTRDQAEIERFTNNPTGAPRPRLQIVAVEEPAEETTKEEVEAELGGAAEEESAAEATESSEVAKEGVVDKVKRVLGGKKKAK